MKFFTKKITVPAFNETKQVEAVQLWEVRWSSIIDITKWGSWKNIPQMEAFISESTANEFADSLRSAQKLLRLKEDKNSTGALKVTVIKAP